MRLDRQSLLEELTQWNSFLKKRVHLIACGGTAMTLIGVKSSTKDVDFMVPEKTEYHYLLKTLQDLGFKQVTGYGWQRSGSPFRFDLFPGKRIHTTELFESPLEEGRHELLKKFTRLYVGILNDYDLIASKLMRGTQVDLEDCEMLVKARGAEIDLERLENHCRELAKYDVAEDRVGKNINNFMAYLREVGLHDE